MRWGGEDGSEEKTMPLHSPRVDEDDVEGTGEPEAMVCRRNELALP